MLTRRSFTALPLAAAAYGQRRSRPNVVLILADDLGYGDLGCYNKQSKIPTPNLDKLAANGIRFTDAHTPSAVCTPTRYGLLTGRYAWRTRLKSGVLDGFDPPLVEKGRKTLASMLKQQGYRTGCVGKWHLGMQWTQKDGSPVPQRESGGFRPGYEVDYSCELTGGPLDCGFDSYFGISASLDMPPYCFIRDRRPTAQPSLRSAEAKDLFLNQPPGVRAEGFELDGVMPELVREAKEFIGRSATDRRPFFLYMPLTAPHLPIVPGKRFEGRSSAGQYGDFVVEVDDAVGQIVLALQPAGVRENTLILFSSDNGGLWHWWKAEETDDVKGGAVTPRGAYVRDYGHASNAHLRGTKADIWEGGHRVPLIVSWPGRIRQGSVCDHLVCLTDVMATAGEITGTPVPKDAAEDSVSFLPSLTEPRAAAGARKSVVLHSLHGEFALREGDWKYVPSRGSGGFSKPVRVAPGEGEPEGQLFNLRRDPAENRNVYAENPALVRRLQDALAKARNGGAD